MKKPANHVSPTRKVSGGGWQVRACIHIHCIFIALRLCSETTIILVHLQMVGTHVPWHTTEASLSCELHLKLKRLTGELGQLTNAVSDPLHLTNWNQTWPSPGPNAGGSVTATATVEVEFQNTVVCIEKLKDCWGACRKCYISGILIIHKYTQVHIYIYTHVYTCI